MKKKKNPEPTPKSKWRTVGDPTEYQTILGRECEIVLTRRPHYCDRGTYVAQVFPVGKLALEIDCQDGFPRYYFDESRAKLEIEAWLEKRGQTL